MFVDEFVAMLCTYGILSPLLHLGAVDPPGHCVNGCSPGSTAYEEAISQTHLHLVTSYGNWMTDYPNVEPSQM